LNLLLAAAVLWLSREREPDALPTAPALAPGSAAQRVRALLLAAAFITGAASFIYEIAWIRMLSLVLGASFQAFELMLSAFITGLALGGLWVRKRIDRFDNPLRFGGFVQVAMGLAALATIPSITSATTGWNGRSRCSSAKTQRTRCSTSSATRSHSP
jgi:hypothetical protein